MLIMSVSHHPR